MTLKETVIRREWLVRNVPPCPSCSESRQIQLVDWLREPAEWRCRACKYRWTWEPEIEIP